MTNTIRKINKDREYQANIILEKVFEIHSECELNGESCNDMVNRISDYIEKEHLFKS